MTLNSTEHGRIGGRFVVEREVGRGGAGTVYRAYDLVEDCFVALKIVSVQGDVASEERARLTREGELLSNLDHPGIVKIVASGLLEDSGLPFVAMEWLDGEDLARRHARQPFTLPQALELGAVVAEALAAAHESSVVHRDIKPSNIFLCEGIEHKLDHLDALPKIVDFGVALADDARVTRVGDIVGTPAYMAPEQARGDASADARSDIYSLGATLFELVAGRPPHVGPTAIATLARLVTTSPPRLSELRQGISPLIDSLIARMLSLDPLARPHSMGEVIDTLRDALKDAQRISWSDISDVASMRLGSSASRLITTIVALNLGTASARDRALDNLVQRGAEAVPIGQDSIVVHLGVRRAVGNEAATAVDLGRSLSRAGAQVGIASGRARVSFGGQSEAQPVGEVVDRASALAREAACGQVLADASTSELGRGHYEFRARSDGSAVVGEPMRAQRGERPGGAPFVGRDAELAQVMSAFERSVSDATPILVSISGPPGIGKSRLRREVMARISALAENPHVVLQRSEAYGRGHALGAAADVLRAMIGLPKGTTSEEAALAIVNRLGPNTRNELTGENRELLARLLANEALPDGIDPRGSRDVLWLAMTDVVLQAVANEPTAILMEDLQWADPESIGWIDHMLGRASNRPLLVMALLRPEFWSENSERFVGRDHVRLELRPISKNAARTIASSLLGSDAPESVLEGIAQQAGGLPLFAEELARLSATGRSTSHTPTIETAIQASLDALDEECRDAVGRLSVLGLTCWDSALEALGMRRSESLLKALAASEFLVEQNVSRFTGSSEWVFKHALVRDVVYRSLGEAERRELHALAADWLLSIAEDAATIAGHYDLGGKHHRAADHWARAAQRALAANALNDALTMAERALAFAEDKPSGFKRACYLDEAWSRLDPRASDRETAIAALEENAYDEGSRVRARGARARYDDALGSGEQIDERLAQARDEAAELGLHDEEARCSAALASRLAYAGRLAEAAVETRRLLNLAETRNIPAAAVDAYQVQAIVRQTQGALTAALEARRNAAAAARKAGLKEREATLTTNVGFALTTIGARQEARTALESGLSLGDAIGSIGAVRNAQMNLLGWAATFGNDKRLDAILGEVRASADTTASGVWAAFDRANLGVLFYRGVELLRHNTDAACMRARALLEMAANAYRSTGHRDVLPVALGMWSEAERRCANLEQALKLSREAAELVEAGAPSLLNESTIYLSLHDAELASGHPERAREAILHGLKPLLKRLKGLVGTDYARLFLTELPHNATLLGAAETYGLVPDEVRRLLERGAN